MHIAKWKKPISKGYILGNYNITFWKRPNSEDSVNISGFQGWNQGRERGINSCITGEF